jgi:hypothetical protein
VVEIEHNRICDSTIDARVLEQDVRYPLLEHGCQRSRALCVAGDIGHAIRCIVLPTELGNAALAHSMPFTLCSIAEPELLDIFVEPTPRTDLHGYYPP